jgi:alpha-1,3-mannosyltransferase
LDEDALELCIQREIQEEVGVDLDLDAIKFVGFSNDPRLDGDVNKHFVTMLFKAIIPDNAVIQNLEPHKCEGWEWTTYEQLIEYESEGRLFVPMMHILEKNVVDKTFWRSEVQWHASPVRKACKWAQEVLYTPFFVTAVLCLLEALLCAVIINKVPYTEIDWVAYMQEVQGYLSGERNYALLKGDTGPLVYPAGFLYIFSVLHWVTGKGVDVRLGQWIFAGLYMANLGVVLAIYTRLTTAAASWAKVTPAWKQMSANTLTSVPLWAWGLLVLSKRVHSLFVLRMFNDCVATFFGYVALFLFMRQSFRAGSFIYSVGVSVKMNMLLWAPGVLLVLLLGTGVRETVVCLSVCAAVQIALGFPFLTTYVLCYTIVLPSFLVCDVYVSLYRSITACLHSLTPHDTSLTIISPINHQSTQYSHCLLQYRYPVEYVTKAFELSRVFKYEWTVNFRFLAEEVFVAKPLSVALLGATVVVIALFAHKWMVAQSRNSNKKNTGGALIGWDRPSAASTAAPVSLQPHFVAVTILVANFIGVAFARTLHYQFYSWYFHSLPLLLWHTRLPAVACLALWVGIEVAFNVFPSTAWSSLLLQACHAALLLGLYLAPAPLAYAPANEEEEEEEEEKKEK